MKRLIFLLALLIIAIHAWEDDEDECSVNFNNKHCGERGKECNGGTSCIDGHCACVNSHECNGGCVDIKYDVDHCGACDVKCSPNQLCINGVCTCPNNDNACTNSPNEPCGRCNAGQYCDLNDSGGTCTCLNNDNACGPTCTACLPGQHCELVNGASKCISGACPNTPTACGNNGVCTNCASISPNSVCSNGACACPQTSTACGLKGACTDCTQNGASPNSVCSGGACMCPNIDSACSSVANCGACGDAAPSCCEGKCVCPNTATQCTHGNSGACSTCNVESGEVCVNGACGCCVDNTCTQCPRGSTGCTPADANMPGSCCTPGGNACTADSDCCSGTCTGNPGFCTGCVDLNSNNSNNARGLGTCDPTPGFPAFTQTSCRALCTNHGTPFSYYSVTYKPLTETTIISCCLCYDSSYHFYPLTDGDPLCGPLLQADNALYGRYTGTPFTFASPSSEYVFIA